MSARLVNVILVEDAETQTYYTLEGVEIGKPLPVIISKAKRTKGGVVTSPSPKDAKAQKERDVEKQIDEMSENKV